MAAALAGVLAGLPGAGDGDGGGGPLPAGAAGLSGVVSLLALDQSPVAGFAVVPGGLAGTLVLVQALGDAGVSAPLWTLTFGAVAAGSGPEPKRRFDVSAFRVSPSDTAGGFTCAGLPTSSE